MTLSCLAASGHGTKPACATSDDAFSERGDLDLQILQADMGIVPTHKSYRIKESSGSCRESQRLGRTLPELTNCVRKLSVPFASRSTSDVGCEIAVSVGKHSQMASLRPTGERLSTRKGKSPLSFLSNEKIPRFVWHKQCRTSMQTGRGH